MSGGSFDYAYHRISMFADSLRHELSRNQKFVELYQVPVTVNTRNLRFTLGDQAFLYFTRSLVIEKYLTDEEAVAIENGENREITVTNQFAHKCCIIRSSDSEVLGEFNSPLSEDIVNIFKTTIEVTESLSSLAKSLEWFSSGDTSENDVIQEFKTFQSSVAQILANHKISESSDVSESAIPKIVKSRWRAKEGELYFYVTNYGTLCQTINEERFADSMRYHCGNFFKTKEEARASKIYQAFERRENE
jgi:hypothetical protein